MVCWLLRRSVLTILNTAEQLAQVTKTTGASQSTSLVLPFLPKDEPLFDRRLVNLSEKMNILMMNHRSYSTTAIRESQSNLKGGSGVKTANKIQFVDSSQSGDNSEPLGIIKECLAELEFPCDNFSELNQVQMGSLIGTLVTKYNSLHSTYMQEIVLPLLRAEIEFLEQKYLPSRKLDKAAMVTEIKLKEITFSIPESIEKHYELSVHYVHWRYIFLNSDHGDIKLMKDFFEQNNLSLHAASHGIAKLYAMASSEMHNKMKSFNLNDVIKALKKKGIQDHSLVLVARAIFAIPKNIKNELPEEESTVQTPVDSEEIA